MQDGINTCFYHKYTKSLTALDWQDQDLLQELAFLKKNSQSVKYTHDCQRFASDHWT